MAHRGGRGGPGGPGESREPENIELQDLGNAAPTRSRRPRRLRSQDNRDHHDSRDDATGSGEGRPGWPQGESPGLVEPSALAILAMEGGDIRRNPVEHCRHRRRGWWCFGNRTPSPPPRRRPPPAPTRGASVLYEEIEGDEEPPLGHPPPLPPRTSMTNYTLVGAAGSGSLLVPMSDEDPLIQPSAQPTQDPAPPETLSEQAPGLMQTVLVSVDVHTNTEGDPAANERLGARPKVKKKKKIKKGTLGTEQIPGPEPSGQPPTPTSSESNDPSTRSVYSDYSPSHTQYDVLNFTKIENGEEGATGGPPAPDDEGTIYSPQLPIEMVFPVVQPPRPPGALDPARLLQLPIQGTHPADGGRHPHQPLQRRVTYLSITPEDEHPPPIHRPQLPSGQAPEPPRVPLTMSVDRLWARMHQMETRLNDLETRERDRDRAHEEEIRRLRRSNRCKSCAIWVLVAIAVLFMIATAVLT
ncbi:Ov10 protein [Ovine gammaherpesvirus 2]|uniref:Ov10 protein n=1 Tax=Ovine gammaherpesvirus 2 TaxID=10398 RepID=Q2VSG6_9GAMA|nr:Ov10 protein [Ovine gammaherpesvirus 2]AAX58110.1 Ov10 protein [Ovine gammaherpesvirus 2]